MAAILELVAPQAEIMQRLQALGWEVGKIDFKGGKYVAVGDAAHGQSFTATGQTPEMALVGVYNYALRANDARARSVVSAWQQNWYKDLHEIAKEYADLPQYEDGAAESWMALAWECQAHSLAIQQQIQVELSDEFQPYESPVEMREDVHKKSRLLVSRIETNHPLWTEQEVIDFRICHDVLGICQSGGGWSWPGANMAADSHLPLLSPLAQEALFVEVVGRTAYETVYRGLGGPKVALLSEFLKPVQESEGVHIHVPNADWFGVTKTAERDPNYLYVYYGSELHIKPFETNLKHEMLLRELLDEYGMDFGNQFHDIDPMLVDAGRLFVENEELRIEHDQLNDPEVREHSEAALHDWWHREQWHSWKEDWFQVDEWESWAPLN